MKLQKKYCYIFQAPCVPETFLNWHKSVPKHPNMILESYDSLPFLDDESEMQELTLFQKQTSQTC